MRLFEIDNSAHQAALEKTGYWGEAAAGAIIMAETTGRYLLAKRSSEVTEPLTWSVWGGAIDEGEDPKEAAIRELREETKYTGKVVSTKKINVYRDGSFTYTTFKIIVPDEFTPTTNWENCDWGWFESGIWPSPLHFGLVNLDNMLATNG